MVKIYRHGNKIELKIIETITKDTCIAIQVTFLQGRKIYVILFQLNTEILCRPNKAVVFLSQAIRYTVSTIEAFCNLLSNTSILISKTLFMHNLQFLRKVRFTIKPIVHKIGAL